ncbi:MAG: peptidoglycan DD-metalloendopeptidase family protein [Pseudomonadota bacterium]
MRAAAVLLLCPVLAAGAWAQQAGIPISAELQQARAEQASAEAETARLEKAASGARGEAERLRAEQVASAQAIEAAEARITAADVEVRLASAYVAAHRRQLATEQRPLSSLLAGLAVMGRRPPLLAIADRGSTDELVKVRLLLDSTLPVIRRRTARLSAELAQGQRLRQAALDARSNLARSQSELAAKRQQFAALERKAIERALSSGDQALGTSDVAIAAGEDVERLRAEQSSGAPARAIAARIAAEPSAPLSPFAPERGAGPSFAYQLPAAAPVTEGLAAVSDSGVRSRGLTMATPRGSAVTAPADGIVKFSGPFRDFDGVLIIDHGGGWTSLLVNVSSTLKPGDRVRLGQAVGRALGPLQVELSKGGRRISPALIAGSSATLSKANKGG